MYCCYVYWNYRMDPIVEFCNIHHANEEEIEHDGDNMIGGPGVDGYELTCYDTLEKAIENSHYWPLSITFDDTFTPEELKIIEDKINSMIHSKEFCDKFPRPLVTDTYKAVQGTEIVELQKLEG